MQMDEMNVVTEQINAGGEVPGVESSLIEQMWKATSSIPKDLLQGSSTGMHAVASAGPSSFPEDPEQRVGLLIRYALMNALIERGLLDDYMKDEVQRKKVFAAAAQFPCDKNDLGEAIAQKLNQQTNEELRQAGYDPDHPKVGERFIAWMREHSS